MSGASRDASARNTTAAVGERQMLPRQTKRILTALSYAVTPPGQAGAERAAILRRLLRHRGGLLPLLLVHLHLVLLDARGIARRADHGAGEAAEDRSRAPVVGPGDRGPENRARYGTDRGAGARRGPAGDHSILRRDIRRAGIEAGLVNGPETALVSIPALLVGRLAVLGIGVNGGIRRRARIGHGPGRRPRRRGRLTARQSHRQERKSGQPGDTPEGRLQRFDTHELPIREPAAFRERGGELRVDNLALAFAITGEDYI